MKPIGYYVDTKIPVVGEIEQRYGSMLQKISQGEKIYLAFHLCGNLEDSHPDARYRIENICEQIDEHLSEESDVIGLLKALVNSL
ncbi:hypothetical protein IJ00_08070 [Calothrix sp. 336/3]|uniref:hypothetical protein n=1 Tax=Calothrix sp. 336/3 TaxID=1337936 RepID=UPI0004E4137C|nr:hypothetical protein [Calothrix sp. 336/3]AKG21259.1 hypothetical protein IJ00_08070 [Calothrix sp. 336/3]